MKLVALLILLAAACGSSSPAPGPDGGGGADGPADGGVPPCPQFRVEPIECQSTTSPDGVLHKGAFICATCKGVDQMGTPTPKPLDCTPIQGNDLCVDSCGACS
jgi:hypothetical protein